MLAYMCSSAGASGPVSRSRSGAEADRSADLGPVLTKAIEHLFGVGATGADQQKEELVTADAENDVALAHRPAKGVGEGHQQLVPGLVAVAVVITLEVVQVDEHDGGRTGVPRKLGAERAPVQ